MMVRQQRVQKKLFYTKFSLDQRVPKNNISRKVAKYIDFDFIYKEVKDKYGSNGNVSVSPPVILKTSATRLKTRPTASAMLGQAIFNELN